MPKSDTWPGGTGLEVVPGMDSSGSCDSVLSTNSGCSDDSLEYLSAEEKACLMFLEETIDSLDTEDDSGLSNDEAEQTPSPGTVASKQAELTASFNRSTSNSDHKEIQKQSIKTNCEKLPSYLVPTPFVIANTSQSSSVPSAPSKRNFATKPNRSISDKERSQTISPIAESRTIPPAVPPKPKKKPENSTKMALSSSRSFCVKRTPNPEMVRQEALHKLGLIKETDENAHSSTTAGVHRGLNSAHGRFVKTPTNSQAARSPSFCVTRLLPETKSKGLQCSASFHHSSRHDHSAATHHHHHHHHHHTTSSQHNHANGPNYPVQSEKGPPDTALSKTPKPSSAVGYTAMVVPGMGADRREALRKLGLLKD
uniref:Specifically androgen-regulated gene protein n=1 Tax=Knipowitschia caucasica TaxID=637954 RepID=A0AAV2M735_KNICA